MMDYAGRVAQADTYPKLLRLNASEHGAEIALREKDFGLWREISWADYQERVRNFALGMRELGVKRGDVIGETVVLGAGRDQLAAMICIRFSIISKWAEKKRISFTTYTDLASRPEVYALLRKEVEAVNATLPPAQRIGKFLLLYKELDADDGELTRTRKVRRSVINEKYADIIAGIYGGAPEIAVDTMIQFQDGTTQRIRTRLTVVDLARDVVAMEAAE